MKLTNSQEEYLKTIYILEKNNTKVRVTDIAKKLKITKPSVNKAINNLKDLNLINYETYGEITLTKEGKNISKEIIKRQDILKMFLVEVLEIEEKKAEEEAKSMKYSISEETAKKLKRNFIAIEREKEYVALALKRLELAEEFPEIQGYENGIFRARNG